MDPAHLEYDEVLYELRLRGVTGVDGHRRCTTALRQMLKRESESAKSVDFPLPADCQLEPEILACERKIFSLTQLCTSTDTL